MIAQATASQLASWTPETEAALRQCGQLAAYGAEQPFLRFYEDEAGNRLSVMEDVATLYMREDSPELRLFLTMDSTVHSVRTDRETAKTLAAEWGVAYESGAVMEAPPICEPLRQTALQTPLRDIYPILKTCFAETIPPFDAWYADVHHRFRRGLCRAVGIPADTLSADKAKEDATPIACAMTVDATPIACAMTVAECETAALIGAVATLPAARSRGYASACVLTLAQMLQQEGKRVLLSPKNDYARQVYEHIGFTVCGEWGVLHR